ncbi:DUF488 family protein [Candidatus Poriferisodalis sp.]|uniref:DUF488 domain-containing protein n=1 Tax=Candidatus Poriferisodalis sp. TaxID=3101277 RepID=UPI003C6ED1CF
MNKSTKLWTIGHSNHPTDRFLALLQQHGIETVVDVRSQPYSRFSPHFRQSRLRDLLSEIGIGYLFLGDELGGRPKEPELYDDAGNVLYDRVARTRRFANGLRRLMATAATQQVAAMCSEEDPTRCHRRLLITQALLNDDAPPTVMHIRGDSQLVSESEMETHELTAGPQLALFDEDSSAPVRHRR